jgi:hypothetical protein
MGALLVRSGLQVYLRAEISGGPLSWLGVNQFLSSMAGVAEKLSPGPKEVLKMNLKDEFKESNNILNISTVNLWAP